MTRPALRLALVGAVALHAVVASAYVPSEAQWNPASLPIQYRVNPNTAPSSIGASGALAAIDGGMASWAAPTCTRWRATNAGTTSVTRASARDNVNTFLWLSGSWPAELGSVNVTIGVTTPVFVPGRYVLDADIQFNAVGFQWSTTGARGTVDTQSIATHEEGHFLGLDHTRVTTAVMFASYSGGVLRNLHADDIAGVCALYPSGGPVPDAGTPTTDPCARYTSCAGCTPVANCGWCSATNTCQTGTSSGSTVGPSCGGGWRWDPRTCATTPADAGSTTDPCNAFTSCGTCTAQNQCGWCASTGRCVLGTPTGPAAGGSCGGYAWTSNMCSTAPADAGTAPTGTATFGEPCRERTDCASGLLCVGSTTVSPFCSRVCTDDCTCPRGYGCAARLSTGQTVCVPGANGCMSGGPTDAGSPAVDVVVPRDVVTPRDVIAPSSDVVTPSEDVVAPSEDVVTLPQDPDAGIVDAGEKTPPADPVATNPGGCGCSAPGSASPRAAGLSMLAGLALVAASSRRRRR